MRILVAPGRGNLGSAIAGDLADRGQALDCLVLPTDDPTPENVGDRIADAAKGLGGVDGLVIVAEADLPDPDFTCTPEDWDAVFVTNTRSVWLWIKAAYPYLKESQGAVAVVVPPAALVPDGLDLAKGASLASTLMFVRVFAQEVGRDGVRVNIVTAGGDSAAGAADAALFLLSPDAGYISGQTLSVDDGRIDRAAGSALET